MNRRPKASDIFMVPLNQRTADELEQSPEPLMWLIVVALLVGALLVGALVRSMPPAQEKAINVTVEEYR